MPSESDNLFRPECAGASLQWHEKCPRCGAARRDNCGDNAAYEAQLERRGEGRSTFGQAWRDYIGATQFEALPDHDRALIRIAFVAGWNHHKAYGG